MNGDRDVTRRLVRTATFAVVRGTATAVGTGIVTLIIWWITRH